MVSLGLRGVFRWEIFMGNLFIFVQKYLIARWTYFLGWIFPRCSVFVVRRSSCIGQTLQCPVYILSSFFRFVYVLLTFLPSQVLSSRLFSLPPTLIELFYCCALGSSILWCYIRVIIPLCHFTILSKIIE